MSKKKIQKHIFFTQTQIDILDDMIKNIPGINSYSEAARYAVLSMNDRVDSVKVIKDMERKLNAIAKNIDILVQMVAGGFHDKEVKAIGDCEDTYIYKDAKKIVENLIQRATTIRTNSNHSNISDTQISNNIKKDGEEIEKQEKLSTNFY